MLLPIRGSLLLVAVLAVVAVNAQQNPCQDILVAPNNIRYDISQLIGAIFNATLSDASYQVSICASNVLACVLLKPLVDDVDLDERMSSSSWLSCGLCERAGFCEEEQWYTNCVGVFSQAIPRRTSYSSTCSSCCDIA